MEGYQLGGRRRRIGEKVHRLRNIIGRHKIDRGRLKIVYDPGWCGSVD